MEEKQKNIVLSLVPAFVAGIIFLLAWTTPNVDLKDPWYRALDDLNEGIQLRQESPERAKDKFEKAGEQFEKLVEEHPYHAKLRMLYGYYFLNTGNIDKGVEELKVAIDKGKGGIVNQIEFKAGDMLTQAVVNQTNAMLKKAKEENKPELIKEVNEYLAGLVEYAPHNPNMQFQYGLSFAQMGNPYKALEYYEKAIRLNPKHEPAGRGKAALNFALGNKMVSENNFQQAYVHYRIAQSIIPHHPDYNNNLGNVALRLNKFDEAVQAFQRAVKKYPNNKTYQGNLNIAKAALAKQKKQNGK